MLDLLKQKVRMTETENGAATYETSGSECLDLFASIGAFRHAGDEEIIILKRQVLANVRTLVYDQIRK